MKITEKRMKALEYTVKWTVISGLYSLLFLAALGVYQLFNLVF